jgi:hypothetical protein
VPQFAFAGSQSLLPALWNAVLFEELVEQHRATASILSGFNFSTSSAFEA